LGNQHQVSWLISAHGGRKTAQEHFTQRTYGPFGEEVMSDTQKDCPDCREFETTRAKQIPVPTEMVLGASAILGMAMMIGMTLILIASTSWLSGNTGFVNMFAMGLGVLMAVGAATTAGALYLFIYRPSNQIGYETYAFLTASGVCHHHLKEPIFGVNDSAICLKGRVGGHKRETKVTRGAPSNAYLHYDPIETWDGRTVKLGDSYSGKLEVSYRTALALMATNGSVESLTDKYRATLLDLNSAREDAESKLKTAYTELYIIHMVTNYEDPLELGRSPYGKFIHEHVGKTLHDKYSPKFRGYIADAHHEAEVAMQKLIRDRAGKQSAEA
jgi:hypothetical protein